jgi:hypothetical protein
LAKHIPTVVLALWIYLRKTAKPLFAEIECSKAPRLSQVILGLNFPMALACGRKQAMSFSKPFCSPTGGP